MELIAKGCQECKNSRGVWRKDGKVFEIWIHQQYEKCKTHQNEEKAWAEKVLDI